MIFLPFASGGAPCNLPIYYLFENQTPTSARLSEPTYRRLPPRATFSSYYLCKLPHYLQEPTQKSNRRPTSQISQ